MSKFNPHYELKITYPYKDSIEKSIIKDPVSIKFIVEKNNFSDTNTTRITVYNMDLKTRTAIYQDNLLFNDQTPKTVTLSAGYGDKLTQISYGYIQQCYTTRQGVDMVTEIIVIDPDILTCNVSTTFVANSEKKEAYLNIANTMPNLNVGVGSENVAGNFQIDTVFEGNSFILINELTGGHTFVDDGVLHTLYENQTISNYGVYYIAADTGLLGTPVRQDARLQIKMLFEPTIRIGQLVEIKSETFGNEDFRFDGQYKVIGITHDCSISNSEGGNRITTLFLNYQEYLDMANVALTGYPQQPQTTKFENGKELPIYGTVSKDDEGICRYIKTHGGNVPTGKDGRVTSLITWQQIFYSGKNQKADVAKEVTPEIIANCRTIATRLTNFCSQYFPNKVLNITSGYRTRQNNTNTENSAKKSLHLSGNAIDFNIKGVSMSQLINVFASKQLWKFGLGVYNTFLHVSNKNTERFRGK